MKHLAFAFSLGAVILTAQTTSAQIGVPLDHMVCYRMMDGLKLPQPNSTDLLAQLQPEFTQKGCRLIKAVEFCVPATKTNVQPFPPDPNIHGTPLKNDYICYLAQCKNQIPPPDKKVIDQFGLRLQQNYHLTKVCVPAQKGPLGCPVGPIAAGGPKCAGACPLPTQLCKTFSSGGHMTCDCVNQPKPCGGKPDAAGMCGGTCPAPPPGQPADQCVLTQVTNSDGTVSVKCDCEPPNDPFCSRDAATGACGGKCKDPTLRCVNNAATGKCDCQPYNPPCRATQTGTCGTTANPCITNADCPKGVACTPGALVCGGGCPLPTQTCQQYPGQPVCECLPRLGCSQDLTTGQCSGICPTAGDVCVLDSNGKCGCGPQGCHSDNTTTPPTCGGPCPVTGQQCVMDAAGTCNCDPSVPCQNGAVAGSCGGTCQPIVAADGTTYQPVCRIHPGTTQCDCQ